MRRRLDRLLAMLDRLDERVGFAPGGRFNRPPGRTRAGRRILRFTAWAYRRPVRNAMILYGVSFAWHFALSLLRGRSLSTAALFAALISVPVWVLPIVAPAGRRRLEELGYRAREESGGR